jgi:hypothetical protein
MPRKQIVSSGNWISKKMLIENKNMDPPLLEKPEIPAPIVDPEAFNDTQIDVYHEAAKMGMKEPLPEEFEPFIRWLEMKKKREIARYIDLSKFDDSDNEQL